MELLGQRDSVNEECTDFLEEAEVYYKTEPSENDGLEALDLFDIPIGDALFDDSVASALAQGLDFDFDADFDPANFDVGFDSTTITVPEKDATTIDGSQVANAIDDSRSPAQSTLPDDSLESADEGSFTLMSTFGDQGGNYNQKPKRVPDYIGDSLEDNKLLNPSKVRRCGSNNGSVASTTSSKTSAPTSNKPLSPLLQTDDQGGDPRPTKQVTNKANNINVHSVSNIPQAVPVSAQQTTSGKVTVINPTSVVEELCTVGLTPAQIRRAKRERKMARNRELAAQSRLRRKKMYAQLEQENKELRAKLAAYEKGLIKPAFHGSDSLPLTHADATDKTSIAQRNNDHKKKTNRFIAQGTKAGTAALAVAFSVVAFADTSSIGADRQTPMLNVQLLAVWAVILDVFGEDSEKLDRLTEAAFGAQRYYVEVAILLVVCLALAVVALGGCIYLFSRLDQRSSRQKRFRESNPVRRVRYDRRVQLGYRKHNKQSNPTVAMSKVAKF